MDIDKVHGYKDCPNYMPPPPHPLPMIGDKENLWFLDILKHSILELILFERLQKEWELSSLEFKLLHVVTFSESCRDLQESTVKRCLLILDSKPFRP